MKKIIRLSITPIIALAIMLVSCSGPKPEKTIENLKAAITGESNASARYAAFAAKAREEGLDTIAKMFDATSKAESIHAANHTSVLNKLGVEFTPQIDPVNALTTKENLQAALEGETNEVRIMYPDFLKVAEEEKASDAIKSFTWAKDTEVKHMEFYKKALDELNINNSEKALPIIWYVCPKCGNTFPEGAVDENCSFCMTPKDKYITL